MIYELPEKVRFLAVPGISEIIIMLVLLASSLIINVVVVGIILQISSRLSPAAFMSLINPSAIKNFINAFMSET